MFFCFRCVPHNALSTCVTRNKCIHKPINMIGWREGFPAYISTFYSYRNMIMVSNLIARSLRPAERDNVFNSSCRSTRRGHPSLDCNRNHIKRVVSPTNAVKTNSKTKCPLAPSSFKSIEHSAADRVDPLACKSCKTFYKRILLATSVV
jgi:hypothetical protein